MSSSNRQAVVDAESERLWLRYSDNWVRHLGVVAEQGDQRVRESLEAAGYSSLDSQLIAPLSLLFIKAQRASEMAVSLGVSQAYTTKLVSRLEKSGYSDRLADPTDRRARWVQLSRSGRKLIQSALKQLEAISRQQQDILGDNYKMFLDSLRGVGLALLELEERDNKPPGLDSEMSAVVLGVVSELVQRAIGRMNAESGHAGLTIAHWRVIHDMGLHGSTTTQLAEKQSLSTQAISRTVRELTAMGYIERTQHVRDARISRLIYSLQALDLLSATAGNIERLAQIVGETLPVGQFTALCDALKHIHDQTSLATNNPGESNFAEHHLVPQLKAEFEQLLDLAAQDEGRPYGDLSLFSREECELLVNLLRAKLRDRALGTGG